MIGARGDDMPEQQEALPELERQGPYLTMALFCEKVLREQDNVFSVIRVIDRVIHTVSGPNAPASMPAAQVVLTALVAFRAGNAPRGPHQLRLQMHLPDKTPISDDKGELPFVFGEGANAGITVEIHLNVTVTTTGLHWCSVLLDGQLMTRIPLQIEYRRLVVTETTAPAQTES
jgi:hypothetical protein